MLTKYCVRVARMRKRSSKMLFLDMEDIDLIRLQKRVKEMEEKGYWQYQKIKIEPWLSTQMYHNRQI